MVRGVVPADALVAVGGARAEDFLELIEDGVIGREGELVAEQLELLVTPAAAAEPTRAGFIVVEHRISQHVHGHTAGGVDLGLDFLPDGSVTDVIRAPVAASAFEDGENGSLARAAQARELVAHVKFGRVLAEAEVLHLDETRVTVGCVGVAVTILAHEVGDVVDEASGDAASAVTGLVLGEFVFVVAEEGVGGLLDGRDVAVFVFALSRSPSYK